MRRILTAIAAALLASGCLTAPVEAQRAWRADLANLEKPTLEHDGRTREFFIQRPEADGPGPKPLIIALHGGTRQASDIFRIGSLAEQARKAGAILVAPEAIGGNWNDGRTVFQGDFDPSGSDDVGFLLKIMDEMIAKHGADPKRIYFTGASNGGNMSWRMACEHGGRIAAIAPTISTMLANPQSWCPAPAATPVMAFFGMDDQLMRYNGAPVRTRSGQLTEQRLSAPETTAFWAKRNGCSGAGRETALADVATDDASQVVRFDYGGCPAGLEVVRFDVIGGGHTTPGGRDVPGPLGRLLGKTNRDLDAQAEIVAFLLRHSR